MMNEFHTVTAEFCDRGSFTDITAEVKIDRITDPDALAPVVITNSTSRGSYRLWRGALYRQGFEIGEQRPRDIGVELEEIADEGAFTAPGPHADAAEWHANLDDGFWPALIDIGGTVWDRASVPSYVVEVEPWPGRAPGQIFEMTSPASRTSAAYPITDLAGARDFSRRVAAAAGFEPATFTPTLEVVRPDLLPYTKLIDRPAPEELWLRAHVAATAKRYMEMLGRHGLGSHQERTAFEALAAARDARLPD